MKQSPVSAPPPSPAFVDLSALGSTRFVVTVDTEEEFDWSAPFSRDRHGMTHISGVPRFQELCELYGVKPSYLVDYPVTQNAPAVEILGGLAADQRAEIGVQLHPWVNPPFDEGLTTYNSFACNLPSELEREKLSRLHSAIVANLGVYPDSYRAGRYGAGPATPAILNELGIAIDSSVRARFDYSAQGGPDYSAHPVNPYWLIDGELLELPVTTVFGGTARKFGDAIFGRWFNSDTARSALARSSMVERIALTPEGIPVEKALDGINLALAEGIEIINLSFHSPSLVPGHTPYVRDTKDLDNLYSWWTQVFEHLAASGVRPTTMAEIKAASRFGH
ncbi:MAG: polysaccharide deacetylase family protein [Sphingorhabdus sp.]